MVEKMALYLVDEKAASMDTQMVWRMVASREVKRVEKKAAT